MIAEAELARMDAARIDDVMTGQVQPINDDHAIEHVTFTIAFQRPLNDSELALFRRRHDLWAELLPAVREPAGYALHVDDAHAVRFEKAPGVEFAFVRPDGSAVWAMRVLGHEVIIECTRYSRWARVWGAARTHLGHALDLVGESEDANPLVRATLVVQDAFASATADYDLRQVFVDSDLLPGFVFGCGAKWHSHNGWFADVGDLNVLHNVDFSGIGSETDEGGLVRIQHRVTAIRQGIVSDETASERRHWLSEAMESLHEENKRLMARVLQPDLLLRIGLSQ